MAVGRKPREMLASAAGIHHPDEMLAKGDEKLRWIFPSCHPRPCQLAASLSQKPLQETEPTRGKFQRKRAGCLLRLAEVCTNAAQLSQLFAEPPANFQCDAMGFKARWHLGFL